MCESGKVCFEESLPKCKAPLTDEKRLSWQTSFQFWGPLQSQFSSENAGKRGTCKTAWMSISQSMGQGAPRASSTNQGQFILNAVAPRSLRWGLRTRLVQVMHYSQAGLAAGTLTQRQHIITHPSRHPTGSLRNHMFSLARLSWSL